MTVLDLIGLISRRWYVFVIALVCALAGVLALTTSQRMFVTQTEFVMTAPGTSLGFAPPEDTTATLVDFADIVARQYNAEKPTNVLTSPSATLFGNGLRAGTSVTLANSGSQWSSAFGSPVISVQIVESSGQKVQEQLDDIATRINRITKEVQIKSGAKPESFIVASSDPTRIVIGSFGPTRTSKLKGEAIIMFVAMCLATFIAAGLDRRRPRKQQSHLAARAVPFLQRHSPGRSQDSVKL